MTTKPLWPDDVILFDDECVLCSGWAQFVARRDIHRQFRFTAIKSDYGRLLAVALAIDADDPDTNAVILGGKVFLRSDAAITVLAALPGWGWFGKQERCDLSFSEVGNRLLS